ncbi:MAG TPA: HD domain-containing protein [Solirubrobacteraceae bacterium]|nr:HD domain-containing protein [Solirubrobacteraceae bacterium]
MSRPRGLEDVIDRLPVTQKALAYAQRQHAGQRCSFSRAPFIDHPLEVGWLLYRAGASDRVVAAGVLHDTVEKTSSDEADLRGCFGPGIARMVMAVSEDKALGGYTRRKAALRGQVAAAGPEALSIFAADKISKVRELRRTISARRCGGRQPEASLLRPRRIAHYRSCLGLLDEVMGPPRALVEQLRGELGRLEGVLPPGDSKTQLPQESYLGAVAPIG